MKLTSFSMIILLSSFITSCERPKSSTVRENIDETEKQEAAKLTPVKDPIVEEILKFRRGIKAMLVANKFNELESTLAEIRAQKPIYKNGSWKLAQFYNAFLIPNEAPGKEWEETLGLHAQWKVAKPNSAAPCIAMAQHLLRYGWKARGAGYANSVTPVKMMQFQQRLAVADQELEQARSMADVDAMWWCTKSQVAKGLGWTKDDFLDLMKEARSLEPKFWGDDCETAVALLPRWYGAKGDAEDYAEVEAANPEGLGAEIYARIVYQLSKYHDNVFRNTRASWEKTKAGLKLMNERYPDSAEVQNKTAFLATLANDREFAKTAFEKLGEYYSPEVWDAERFAHYRNWARTGKW